MRRYYLHTRHSGTFYAELTDPTTGRKLVARSTGKKSRDEAMLVVAEWLKNGIPTGRLRRPRPIEVATGLEAILSSIRKTDLNGDDAMRIVAALRGRGLIDIAAAKAGKGSVDLIEFLETFWDYEASLYVRDKLAHGQRIGKRHCLESQKKVATYFLPVFKDRKLNSITRADLKSFSLSLSERGLAPATINKTMVALTTPLSWAFSEGMIPADVTDGLRRFAGEAKKRGVLTPEEAAGLFRVEWKDDRARVGNLLAATTGLRAGEVLAVRRSDIGEGILYVRHSWSYADGLKKPKSGEERRVPLLPEVRRELLALLDRNPHKVADPFAFYGLLEDKPMDQKLLLHGLKEACGVSGVNAVERGIVFHSWRHLYAARMADRMDAKKIMRATGHATESVFDAYADHVLESDLAEVGKVAGEVFASIVAFRKGA